MSSHRPGEHYLLQVPALPNEVVNGIPVTDPHHVLLNDRPLIEIVGGIMSGGADDLDPSLVSFVIRPAPPRMLVRTSGGC